MRVSPRQLLLSSAACAASFIALMAFVYETHAGRWLDTTALNGFFYARTPERWELADHIASLCDPGSYAVIGGAIVLYAAMARGAKRATAAATLLIVTAISSQVLKPALAEVRFEGNYPGPHGIEAAAFPSGHSTAAMTLALALVLVAPRRYRPLAALVGAPFAIAMGLSVVLMGWHLPSDVFGGYLLAAAWCLAILAVLKVAERKERQTQTQPHAEPGAENGLAVATATGLVGLTAATGIAFSKADGIAIFAAEHTAATVVATGIALAGTATVAAIALVASRRT
jgi:membrane-associated phospholipid phosphatase